jgi:hypothetical protein
MKIAPFQADVTPPLGEIVDCGLEEDPRARNFDHPILAKGVVLADETGTYVLSAFDWGGMNHESHDAMRDAIAAAAGTDRSRVAAQSLHLHTAPHPDTTSQAFLDGVPGGLITIGREYFDRSIDAVREAVRTAMGQLRPVTHVSVGAAPADRLASTRRVRLPDRTIGARFSNHAWRLDVHHGVPGIDPVRKMWPEGKIDGFVRTIAFHDDAERLVAMHYYASHPQSFYGDGRVSWDVPGIARERLQEETGVFQVYFSGCGGDIAFGKYNDGVLETRDVLAERMHDALVRSLEGAVPQNGLGPIRWHSRDLQFGVRQDPDFSEATARSILEDVDAPSYDRIRAAWILANHARTEAGHTTPMSCLQLGSVSVLNLPGDTFVEYQLHAQRVVPAGTFVAVAGYGSCGTGYIGTDEIYSDVGGYEQTWSFIEPSEESFKTAITEILNAS